MKLYYSQGACSMASHILLHELGIKFDHESVDLKSHKTQRGDDFYKINPKGYVPVLKINDQENLTENVAILLYLSELKSPTQTMSMDRYRLIEWLAFISTEIHKSFGALFAQNSPPEAVKAAKEKINMRLDYINQCLKGREFLLKDFSGADCYLFTMLTWCHGMGIDLSKYQNLNSFYDRVQSRPSVTKTLAEEKGQTSGNKQERQSRKEETPAWDQPESGTRR